MKIHEFPWESLIFHKMDARPPPWWKPLIFLREFWCFWRVRAPQNAENPWIPCFYGKSAKFPMIPVYFIEILEMCGFPHACVRPPRNINIPLGISMVSSMSWSHRIMEIAKIMKFHENHGFSWILLKFHEIPWNSHFLCYMGASTPPWLKTLIFLRDHWWFRRPHRLESTEIHVISAIPWFPDFLQNFLFYHKNTSFTRILYFSVARPPQNTNIP